MVQEAKIKFETESPDASVYGTLQTNNVAHLNVTPLAGVDTASKLQSRGGAVSGDNIFEIHPRCSIKAGENADSWDQDYVRRREDILAVTSGGETTGIAIASTVVVFDREAEEPIQQMNFASSVDFIVWRRSIILVGLSSSRILLVDPKSFHVRYSGKPLTNKEELNGQQKFFVDAFIHSNPDPSKLDVIVVSKNGNVSGFVNISLSDGRMDSTFDQNDSLDVDFGAVKEMISFDLEVESEVMCASSPTRNTVITIEKSGRIFILDLNNFNSSLLNPYRCCNLFANLNMNLEFPVAPTKVMSFQGVQFVLLSDGSLQIFHSTDFIPVEPLKLPQDAMIIYDFTLILNNNEGTVKLWALYGKGDENYVGIFGASSFQSEFSYQLPSILNEKDDASCLYKFPSNLSPFEEPVNILEMAEFDVRLYNIMETSTDLTLQKLLSRGKYAEAEDLASEYNKDLDIVRKAEARDKLNKLCSSGRETKENVFQELLEILHKIVDSEFVCCFCVRANLPKVEWVKAILALGKGRVFDCSRTLAANSLLLTIKKFYTFELVYPSGTILEWNSFIAEDNTMFLQAIKFLQNKCFDKCERVWRRHSEDFVPQLSLADFLPFFNCLFEHQLLSLESKSLFRTIIPFAVEKVAGSPDDEKVGPDVGLQEIGILFGIILRQVSVLEGIMSWPLNALDFINTLNAIIQQEGKRLESVRSERETWTEKKKTIVSKIHLKLNNLIQVLEELAELKRNHSIRIPFADYTDNQIAEVISKLLYKLLSKEEVESFVNEYLRPYAQRKGLNVDFLIAEHIKSVMQYIHYYHQAINIPHEERIVSLINLISTSKVKLLCTLQIAEEWPVPWTPGIDSMVKQILDIFPRERLNSESVAYYDKIYILRKQVPYRCVVRKYRLNEVKLGRSQCYISMAILRILKLKKEAYIEDCKELLKNIPGSTLLDEIRLEYLKFCMQVEDGTVDVDDLISIDVITNSKLKKAVLHRAFLEIKEFEDYDMVDLYTEEEKSRLTDIYAILSSDTKDPREAMIAKLKKFLPKLPTDIVYSEEFPYSVLARMFDSPETYFNDPKQLISDCKTLSRITGSYLPDVLLTAGAFFVQRDVPFNTLPVLWSLLEFIVATPLPLDQNNSTTTSEMIQTAGYEIAKYLLPLSPTFSIEQMETLHQFLCHLLNFDDICEEVCKLLSFHRIFVSLKEQEVPLENDFLEVYKWLAGEGRTWDCLPKKMTTIGETLLKFEEYDLFNSIFESVLRNLYSYILKLENASALGSQYGNLISELNRLKENLWNQRKTFMSPNDRLLEKLVKQLNEAGIRVNQYALKRRNKEKLLEKLLQQENYILAGDLGIYFQFYEEKGIWSRILKGLIYVGKLSDLRSVLESIRTVPELWMLEEFAVAWKSVAEVDQSFLDICPIPLD